MALDGSLDAPPRVHAPMCMEKLERISLCRARLDESDRVAVRCAKEGYEFPKAWLAYDAELRRVEREGGELPDKPPYPEFTGSTIWERIAKLEKASEPVSQDPPPNLEDDGIPSQVRSFMLEDEAPEKFTERMRRRYRALKHMQMDMNKPTMSRTFPDMSDEEIAELNRLEALGSDAVKWLDVSV